jgi:hypothetical protein
MSLTPVDTTRIDMCLLRLVSAITKDEKPTFRSAVTMSQTPNKG